MLLSPELKKRAFEHPHLPFWSKENKARLDKVLRDLCIDTPYGISGETFWNDNVVTICNEFGVYTRKQLDPVTGSKPKRPVSTHKALRKFFEKDDKTNAHRFNGDRRLRNAIAIAVFMVTEGGEFRGLDLSVVREFFAAVDPAAANDRSVDAAKRSARRSQNRPPPEASSSETRRFMETIGVESDLIERASKDLFGDKFVPGSEQQRLYFETYRFSKTAGFVDKSYTVINSPTKIPEKDYVDFKNFYLNSSDDKRTTKGMVLRFRHGTYLVGVINDGAALKTLYINDADKTAQTWTGGTLSTDGSHGVLAGRVVMRRTDVPDTTELETCKRLPVGIHSLATIITRKELSDKQLLFLRNRIKFTTERELRIWRDGKYHLCTQEEMVRETQRRLMVDNKPLFIFDNGDDEGKNAKPFNPAADEHYTFNSALDLDNV